MNKNKNTTLAVIGALGALSILLGITRLGIIPWFSGASITVLHVPVIIGALIAGPIAGSIIGLIFGIFSLIQAVIAPGAPLDPYFVNPLVSVLPRVLIAPCTWLTYLVLSKITVLPKVIAVGAAAFVGSLANTAFVLGALALLGAIQWQLGVVVFVANGLPEAAGAVLISIPVCTIWMRIGGRKKSRLTNT